MEAQWPGHLSPFHTVSQKAIVGGRRKCLSALHEDLHEDINEDHC